MREIFDYCKLRGLIQEKCKTQGKLAEDIGISRSAFNQKINNISDFTSQEIMSISRYLNIETSDIPTYFFKQSVQKHEHTYR